MAGLLGGSGCEAPPDAREYSKICKKDSLRKLQKVQYFSIFCKKISKPEFNFRAVGRKHNWLGKFL